MNPDRPKVGGFWTAVGITIAFAALMAIVILLTSCDANGNPDWKTIGTVTRAATGAMTHEREQEDEPTVVTQYPTYPTLYDQFGNPIYPPR